MSNKLLTNKEIAFIEHYMENGSQMEAYKSAYDSNGTDKTVSANAHKVFIKPRVKAELELRRASLARRLEVKQVDIIKHYFKIIDDYNEAMRFAKSDDKKKQAASYRMANLVNSSSYNAALKMIAEMTGLAAPSVTAVNNGIIINVIQPKE